MVQQTTLLAMWAALLIGVLPSVVLWIVLAIRHKGSFGLWIAGALGFAVPQLVIRLPILRLLGTTDAYTALATGHPVVLVLLLAGSAALFETAGRLTVLRYGLKNRLSYRSALAAGAGHGGIEAIALAATTGISNLSASLLLNSGRLEEALSDQPGLAETVRESLLGTSPLLFLAGGLERLFVLPFQIVLTLIMALLLIKKRTGAAILVPLLLHFGLDGAVGLMQVWGVDIYFIEGILLAVGLIALLIVFRVRPRFGYTLGIPLDPAEQAVKEGY